MDEIERLIREIEADTTATAAATGQSALDKAVLDAIRRVNRSAFVTDAYKTEAWVNRPLPIGHRQTISQPFVVALMTDLLRLPPGGRVLEIGTGSGYQAAVLAELGAQVFSVEVIPALAERARLALDAEGYTAVATRLGDGALGWPEHAPFDAIIVTAAALAIPPALVEQLRPGARMAIPIGAQGGDQRLMLVEKDAAGAVTSRTVLRVMFVPLTGPADGLPTE